jgi:hypothetical protein
MEKHFLPSMNQEQVSEMDKRRGVGDTGTYTNPSKVVAKEPWMQPNGTHKAAPLDDDTKEDLAKPILPKRKDESEAERQVRSHVEDAKNNPDKYPGGRDQAIAIGLHQAGVGRKKSQESAMSATKQATKLLKSFVKKGDADATSKVKDLLDYEMQEHGKIPTPAEERAEKALTSRSGLINSLPFQSDSIAANALRIPVRPAELPEAFEPRHYATVETYETCPTHGIVHKSSNPCWPCVVAKSMTCKSCGGPMTKSTVGDYTCQQCMGAGR